MPAAETRANADRYERLADRLRSALPAEDDGSIGLSARAWAVRGGTG